MAKFVEGQQVRLTRLWQDGVDPTPIGCITHDMRLAVNTVGTVLGPNDLGYNVRFQACSQSWSYPEFVLEAVVDAPVEDEEDFF